MHAAQAAGRIAKTRTLLVGGNGFVVLLRAQCSGAHARVALGPLRLQLHHLLCILQGLLVAMQARLRMAD